MNDRQWDDYIRRQPGTFWGELGQQHDRASRPPTYTPIIPKRRREPAATAAASGGSRVQTAPAGPGVIDGASDGVAGLAVWFTRHLWPLKALERAGKWLMGVGWRGNLPLAGVGLFLAAGVAAPASLGLAAVIGAIAGWLALRLVGFVMVVAAIVVGVGLALGVTGLVLWLVYEAVRAFAGP